MQFSPAENKTCIPVIWQFLGAVEGTKFYGRDAVTWPTSLHLYVLPLAREYISGFSNPNVFIQYQKILMGKEFLWVDLIGSIIIMGIQEGLNHSSLAFQVPPNENMSKNDDQLLNYEVNSFLEILSNDPSIHQGPNTSSRASHVLPTDKGATVDDGLMLFKVADSSSCKHLTSSLDFIAVDVIETNTMDTHEQPSHSISATQMLPMYNEANGDDQLSYKDLQFDGSIGDTMSGHDLNCMDPSSCDSFLFGDPAATTTGDTSKPLNLSQMDPADNEAHGHGVSL